MMASVTNGRGGNPWRIIGWGAAASLLLVPLIAKLPWTPADFVFAGAMVGTVGLGLELAVRRRNAAYTMAAGAALAAAFLLVWINAAVGIIGSEADDVNLLFPGVVAAALLGAFAARFRPAGMARAMSVAALAQLLVPFGAALFGLAPMALLLRREVPVLTIFFVALWLVSAALFRKAAR